MGRRRAEFRGLEDFAWMRLLGCCRAGRYWVDCGTGGSGADFGGVGVGGGGEGVKRGKGAEGEGRKY